MRCDIGVAAKKVHVLVRKPDGGVAQVNLQDYLANIDRRLKKAQDEIAALKKKK